MNRWWVGGDKSAMLVIEVATLGIVYSREASESVNQTVVRGRLTSQDIVLLRRGATRARAEVYSAERVESALAGHGEERIDVNSRLSIWWSGEGTLVSRE